MDLLRCRTPEMVHKEIGPTCWRTTCSGRHGGGCRGNGMEPRQVSFKGAKQAVTAFAPEIERRGRGIGRH